MIAEQLHLLLGDLLELLLDARGQVDISNLAQTELQLFLLTAQGSAEAAPSARTAKEQDDRRLQRKCPVAVKL